MPNQHTQATCVICGADAGCYTPKAQTIPLCTRCTIEYHQSPEGVEAATARSRFVVRKSAEVRS